jgi:hypothetical protein
MNNLIAFLNSFLSYALLYVISAGLIITGVLLGIRYRKYKDKKAAETTEDTPIPAE